VAYFRLNVPGAVAPGISATAESQWGFVMLETARAAIRCGDRRHRYEI
jgi:hypothetical protein